MPPWRASSWSASRAASPSGLGQGVEFDAIAAAVLGGTSLFGGVGSVFPGTVIGVLLVQMISTGMVYLQIDLYLQDMVAAAVIFFAVLIDAQRMRILTRLERRNIRVEKGLGSGSSQRPPRRDVGIDRRSLAGAASASAGARRAGHEPS